MSRGLVEAQRLILSALLSLEAERGKGPSSFYVWAIVGRAYALSKPMEDPQQTHIEERATWRNSRDEHAAADDALRRRHGVRRRRKSPLRFMEENISPSRVLASLERRGLVTRSAIEGGVAAGLTDAGREVARGVGSMASSLPPHATRQRNSIPVR